MSQEKVDRYKQEKANRKEILKKEQKKNKLVKIGLGLILAALLVWIGYSVHYSITKEETTQEIDIEALTEYLNSLEANTTEEETEEETEETGDEEAPVEEAPAEETPVEEEPEEAAEDGADTTEESAE